MAAFQGKSIKGLILESTLGTADDKDEALTELDALLRKRQQDAEDGAVSTRTVEEIFEQARE